MYVFIDNKRNVLRGIEEIFLCFFALNKGILLYALSYMLPHYTPNLKGTD